MGKPTLRKFKGIELALRPRVIKIGFGVVLGTKRLQDPLAKTKTKVSIGEVEGAYGAFLPAKNRIVLTKDIFTRETVKHETGHAVDWKNDWVSTKSDSPFKTGGSASPDKEWQKVLVTRFNRYVVPSDRIKTYPALVRRMYKGDLAYMNSSHERFADAYMQYRENPAKFKTYAPTIYNWFKSNAKLL